MSEHQNEPREYDAVKGGQNPPPISAAVLGGIPSIKSRLASPTVYVRAAALPEALKYGEAGLDLIIQALHDQIMSVRFAAYLLLKDRDEEKIKQYLRNYSRFHVYEVHPDCSSIAVGTRQCRVPTSVVYLTNLKSAV